MPYRVLVVDDSAFMRKIISDLIEQDPAYRVEATAKNGREAVEQVAAIQPDLVTMDVEMPELNGLDALKVIMKEHPLPVIMLSGINEQGMRETIMALELGAFDFIRKPSATTSSHDIEEVGRELREQMRVAMAAKERRAARAPVDPVAPKGRATTGAAGLAQGAGPRTSFTDLVAIGTSTGGPKALKAVLEKIPGDFPAPIVIVQHMPPNFTKSLAQRLNSLSELTVVEAEQGERLHSGTAYIAPGGFHLNVIPSPGGGYRIHLTEQEPRNGHRPSVDVLYESLLPLEALKRHAVLLTGMGSDGAKVMKQLYDAGVTSTLAESEETCVVFGMPRSAIELNCVSHVLPLHDIGPKLVQVVK
ncbi:protein-glutamate methylesterase/protein-glutamine glutaminase [Paenibacillus senegalimassiliensis]|uniref:protein-glutamate methylesterase/protein-glutamine glutaminase n=1 Tax=Paenibacillus senegalimassiliensis TaxID=1737426 RepID=UPI00073E5A92|nr:chemotaxis response regulator protein-glutamate methylesterase [Paenibacillus senegalimassiliensis]